MKLCNKLKKSTSTENPPSSSTTYTIAKLDSGASANYFRFQDAAQCLDELCEDNGPEAITPTLETIKATKSGMLPLGITSLGKNARKTHVFDTLGSASLISVANMCDDGCHVVFNKNNVFITKDNKVIIKGNRNWRDRLWDIKVPHVLSSRNQLNQQTAHKSHQQHHHMSVILCKKQSKTTLATYHHHTLFAPTESTLRKAIKNNHLSTWPGLTQQLLTQGFMPDEATAKGHLKQERQNLQSTKTHLQHAIEQSSHVMTKQEDEDSSLLYLYR